MFDSDTIAIVDGNRGFGQVTGEFAAKLGIAKARETGIAMIGLRNCGHLGRVGDWADMAAAAGQVSLHFLNTSGAQRVAPFGGSDRRLSTNPISIGVPVEGGDPVVLDVTTSTVAEGKLMVALNKGEQVPAGWIIDKRRRADHGPEGLLRRRRAAHRRRAQGLGTFDGHRPACGRGVHGQELGCRRSGPAQQHAVDLHRAGRLRSPTADVAREARRFVDFVKASAPAKPGEPVLAPGEVERRNRASRLANGVALDDKTWADLARRRRVGGHRRERGAGPCRLTPDSQDQAHETWRRDALGPARRWIGA